MCLACLGQGLLGLRKTIAGIAANIFSTDLAIIHCGFSREVLSFDALPRLHDMAENRQDCVVLGELIGMRSSAEWRRGIRKDGLLAVSPHLRILRHSYQ